MADTTQSDLPLARFLIELALDSKLRAEFNADPEKTVDDFRDGKGENAVALDPKAKSAILKRTENPDATLFSRLHLSNQNAGG